MNRFHDCRMKYGDITLLIIGEEKMIKLITKVNESEVKSKCYVNFAMTL